jgi:hypothetical protein
LETLVRIKTSLHHIPKDGNLSINWYISRHYKLFPLYKFFLVNIFAVVVTNDIICGIMLMKHSTEIKTVTFSVWCRTVWCVQRNILHIQGINSLEHTGSVWYCLHLGVTCLRFEVFWEWIFILWSLWSWHRSLVGCLPWGWRQCVPPDHWQSPTRLWPQNSEKHSMTNSTLIVLNSSYVINCIKVSYKTSISETCFFSIVRVSVFKPALNQLSTWEDFSITVECDSIKL